MTNEQFCEKFCTERRGTGTLKWDSLEEIFGDAELTPLWVADMEFKSPDAVVDAIKKRAEHGAFGYGMVENGYYEAFAAWQKNHHGMTVTKDEIRFCTGVVGALYTLVSAFTQTNDAVVICPPVYYPFYDAVLNTGRTLALCELDNNGGVYTLDFAKFEKTIADSKAKMFILCSPHNPIGRVWTTDELEKMFEICARHDVLIISDEIHQDFTYPDFGITKFTPSNVVCGTKYKDRIITVNSASKTFNLAGLIHSHTIIQNPALMKTYDAHVKTIGQPEANLFGLVAMEAAYRGGAEWLKGLQSVIRSNFDFVKTELAAKAPGIIVTPLEGTYLMWLDLRACVDPEEVSDFMQKKCHLAVDVGEWFSVNAKGFIRINLATNPKYVHLAIKNIVANLA